MVIGEIPAKRGALEKVKGRTLFGVDQGQPSDLVLACVRVFEAPARIEEIDPTPALALPGVVKVFTYKDIPGSNRLGIIPVTKDQQFLAEDRVLHPGQAVALVVGIDQKSAEKGVRAVSVKTTPLPGVFDYKKALLPDAPLVHPEHPTGNLLSSRVIKKGDVEKALSESYVVVKNTYTTSPLEHCALETEGGRARIVDGRLEVKACSQNPHYDQADLTRFLGLEAEQVRVIQAETGGGFGGKLDISVQAYLGLACWLLKKPCRMVYSREESFHATGKRHPFEMVYTTGADKKGRLTAIKAEMLADTGAFASYGLAVAMRAAVHAAGPYFVPNSLVDLKMVYTNNPWYGAMRGFGVPQAAIAHEGQMDALAEKLGMDPWEIRRLNALRPGQETITGQKLLSGVGIIACLDALKPHYEAFKRELNSTPEYLEGVGLGAMYYGIGNTGVSNPSTAQIEWTVDNKVILHTGVADIGQGSDTVLCQMAAEKLGLEYSRMELVRGDTDHTTNAGATSASRQTYISGNAVLNAAEDLKALILDEASEMLEAAKQDLLLSGEKISVVGYPDKTLSVIEVVHSLEQKGKETRGEGDYDPTTQALDQETGQGEPYETYAYAVQAALCQVEQASGMIRIKKVAAAHDVGKAINPEAVKGQIAGGVLMGVGLALMEEYKPGKSENLQDYHIPTAKDAPEINSLIVEEPCDTGPYGAKGVGEPALIPTAPALAAGVGQALGRPMRHMPMSLERVMEALEQRDQEKGSDHDR
ncbi:xanthine dehydrogenase family protein molybdopterin-binding subunit [Dethiosulfatarculus sandiegensis]|uniref:Aldehyde oxidase n=1 Tax=Dethiosulfatarculus sandiegensis TaxID=1429043 RepID=A0A0D2JR68_9BACT|nr:xanthine dehydrogenase family protein molybdopterin-binding subunit [Dethiosulfatarculus sandiegensis]KIX11975.1 aldehyde oxidase [Dethiosulfatarculus sandiegensis]